VFNKGDIILIPFPFTDLKGAKLRPAVVIAVTNLDISLCFITSQIKWQENTDCLIKPSAINGIKTISLIRTSKIATLDKNLSQGFIGNLTTVELFELNTNLKAYLQL
jgi:mRNA interferase MazF